VGLQWSESSYLIDHIRIYGARQTINMKWSDVFGDPYQYNDSNSSMGLSTLSNAAGTIFHIPIGRKVAWLSHSYCKCNNADVANTALTSWSSGTSPTATQVMFKAGSNNPDHYKLANLLLPLSCNCFMKEIGGYAWRTEKILCWGMRYDMGWELR
jgi:hypothetical protein